VVCKIRGRPRRFCDVTVCRPTQNQLTVANAILRQPWTRPPKCDPAPVLSGLLWDQFGRSMGNRMTGSTRHANMGIVTVGALLPADGLAINYLLEHYKRFQVWEIHAIQYRGQAYSIRHCSSR
jgi:hypothetical protein